MSDTKIISGLINQISDGLSTIMQETFPLCKDENTEVSTSAARINNTAYELKKMVVLLTNQIKFTP